MLVGYVQTDPVFGQVKKNLQQAADLIRSVRADLLILPELFQTGYLFQSHEELEEMAESIPGPTTDFLEKLCQRQNLCLVAGILERDGDNFFNSAVAISSKGVIGLYRKIHLFLDEKKWFVPGNLPFRTFAYQGASFGMMICFDWYFPESARCLALLGADLICHPSNLVLPYCQQAMLIRSLENQVFSVTSNRVGEEKRGSQSLHFTGCSQIVGPRGNRIQQSPACEMDVAVREIDLSLARNKNLTAENHIWKDRRVEFYEVITEVSEN